MDEGWVQDILGATLCQNGAYDESIIRNDVDKIQVFDAFIQIYRKDRPQEKNSRITEPMICLIIVNKNG